MRALLLAAVVLLAGCVAPAPGTSPTDSATAATPADSETAWTPTGSCTVDDHPMPDGSDSEVGSVDYPDRPDTLTPETVRSYARAFEESYLHNEALVEKGNVSYLETYVDDVTVSRHGDAFFVNLSSYTNGGTIRQEGNGTPITVHWDGAPQPRAYLLTGDRLIRGSFDRDTTPTPEQLRHQPTVACF